MLMGGHLGLRQGDRLGSLRCLCRICRVSGGLSRLGNGGIRAFRQICVWFVDELMKICLAWDSVHVLTLESILWSG